MRGMPPQSATPERPSAPRSSQQNSRLFVLEDTSLRSLSALFLAQENPSKSCCHPHSREDVVLRVVGCFRCWGLTNRCRGSRSIHDALFPQRGKRRRAVVRKLPQKLILRQRL